MKVLISILVTLLAVTACRHSGGSRKLASTDEQAQSRKKSKASEVARKSLGRLVPGILASAAPAATESIPLPSILGSQVPDPAKIVACIESMCGPADKNWSAYDVPNRPGKDLVPGRIWAEEFEAQLVELMRRDQKLEIDSAQYFLKIANSKLKIDRTNTVIAFIQFARILDELSEKVSEIFEYSKSDGTYVINEDGLEKEVATLPEAERVAAEMIVRRIYAPAYKRASWVDPLANSLTIRLQTLYPGMPLREAQIADARKVRAGVESEVTKLGPELKENFASTATMSVIAKALRGQDLSKIESNLYTEAAGSIDYLREVFSPDFYKVLMAVPTDFDAVVREKLSSRTIELAIEDQRRRNPEDAAKQLGKECLGRIEQSMAMNASLMKVRKIKEIVLKVKEAARSVVTPYAEELELPAVIKSIDEAEFYYPESNDELLQRVRAAFAEQRHQIDIGEKNIQRRTPQTDQLMLLFGAFFQNPPTDLRQAKRKAIYGDLDSILQACEELPVDTVSDFALTSLGKISVSWFTANFPSVGVGILAHEIGHVISAKFRELRAIVPSEGGFTRSKTCVANRNPYQVEIVEAKTFKDTTWSEEDWADHFSSLVLNEMEKLGTANYRVKNKGCALVHDWGTAYSDTTLEPAASDSHSSGIMRLLLVAHDRGQMTPQCAPFLDYAAQNQRPLSCH